MWWPVLVCHCSLCRVEWPLQGAGWWWLSRWSSHRWPEGQGVLSETEIINKVNHEQRWTKLISFSARFILLFCQQGNSFLLNTYEVIKFCFTYKMWPNEKWDKCSVPINMSSYNRSVSIWRSHSCTSRWLIFYFNICHLYLHLVFGWLTGFFNIFFKNLCLFLKSHHDHVSTRDNR